MGTMYLQSDLKTLETGLKDLKQCRLMRIEEFRDMYHAIEKHHRNMRLAHLTGQAPDLKLHNEQDTRFYNILVKMMNEVKLLRTKEQRESLLKVHTWFQSNKHILHSGPKFGKEQIKKEVDEKYGKTTPRTPKSAGTARKSKTPRTPKPVEEKKEVPEEKPVVTRLTSAEGMRNFFKSVTPSTQLNGAETPQGFLHLDLPTHSDKVNEFLTSRFFMAGELTGFGRPPTTETPTNRVYFGDQEPTDRNPAIERFITSPNFLDGPDLELHGLDSPLGDLGEVEEGSGHTPAPRSSPREGPASVASQRYVESITPRSNLDIDPDEDDLGTPHSGHPEDDLSMPELRRKLSRGQTMSASIRGGMSMVSQEQSSNLSTYMPKKMIHPIASLVNPHAQLAAIEAQQAEQEYLASRENSSMSMRASGGSRMQYSASKNRPMSMTRQNTNLSSRPNTSHFLHPAPRPASVAGGPMMPARAISRAESLHSRAENLASWKNFNRDMAYGQDILSNLNFVGRSGTAMDVRYSAHDYGHMPEEETPFLLTLFSDSENSPPTAKVVPLTPRPTEVQEIYTQNSLEEFYQLTDGYYPPKLPKYHHPVVSKPKTPGSTKSDHLDPSSRATSAKTAPLGRDLLGKGESEKKEETPRRSQSEMKLTTVVNMIDTVSGEMNYFKEKLAPSPAPGFRQPSSTGVSRRPLSRPATASGRRSPSPIQPPPLQRTNSPSIMWQRQKFGEHSFVKKLYPGKRPVGATHAGNRPKTAPMTVREKWKIEEKPNEGNIRVSSQAATNTMTLVDDKTMDNIMMVQPIEQWNTGLGSMNSIYLDENFLRSFSSGRYTPGTTVTATPIPMEYVPIVATAPKSLMESRTQSRQTRKSDRADSRFEGPSLELEDEGQIGDNFKITAADSHEDPNTFETFPQETEYIQTEDTTDRQEDNFVAREIAVQTDISRINEREDSETARSVYNEDSSRNIEAVQEEQSDACSVDANVTNPNQQVQFYTEDLHNGKVHIEVLAVPSGGRPPTPPNERDGTSPQQLTKSDTWQFTPLDENQRPYLDLRKKTLNPDLYHKGEHWTKAIVKPENYCFHCLPDSMSTKVGRSAGRMPGRTQSASSQVLRMARKQNEYFKKAPPVRTPPSIPRPYHQTIGQDTTPRQGETYKAELEHHARKVKSPRHFMEQVVELRKGAVQSAPPGSVFVREDSLLGTSLQVCRLPTRSSGFGPSDEAGDESREIGKHVMFDEGERKALMRESTMDSITSRNVTARGVPLSRQSIAHIGRPIAQVSNIHDPLEEAEAARIQFEAKAAVDIQRIFRGYVARNVYKKLLKEERERREDEQKAAVEIQRRYRGHLTRKTKIEKKTGLSPELLQWAKDFKEVQMENALERHKKMTVLSQTNTVNYHKANSKISVIGPHVEIYQIYHPKQTGPTKEELTLAAIQIQKHIRGFIIRKRFEKLERKAVWHGSTFSKMVRDYKNMLRKCQLRHGVDRPKTPFTIQDFNEYLDMRKRYESVFDKKSFGNELELIELEAFFRESDLYPSASEIDEAMDVVLHGHDVKRGLLKNEVLEMVFYIYVPKATGLPMTRQSTWLNPIIDGVEARKLIGSEFVEKAPLEVCAKLVIDSKRERRERENQEKERKLEEELAKNRKTPSSRGSNKTEL